MSAQKKPFQGCGDDCKADPCGYPAPCEMYPTTSHAGCPRQMAKLADRVQALSRRNANYRRNLRQLQRAYSLNVSVMHNVIARADRNSVAHEASRKTTGLQIYNLVKRVRDLEAALAAMPDKPTGTADADGPVPDNQQTLTTPLLVSHHREDEPR